ncbi:MAG TPA: nickel pincer cofactor biosynthesis protein LarB [Candidatus Methanoperedens sp.]|nr:nickel pincer cofactor biosynthesis protein LarB [Candidatus Methanoperedens sp.]
MEPEELRKLLLQVRRGSLGVAAALGRLRNWPTEDLGFVSIDHHRGLRQGQAEVIFCEGKRPAQVAAIVERLLAAGANVLATRATPETYAAVRAAAPRARYNEAGRVISVLRRAPARTRGTVLVMTAGTSDIPVAEEAVETLRALGSRTRTAYDAGVAGLHRILRHREAMRRARVLIVVAGMEGALASVIGGLVDRPLVAVPTSVGYGAGAGGIAPLLTMLNSCAAGVGVVNIDNGFGAAVLAHRINLLAEGRGR